MQAIILAGGFGTRLRSVIGNIPKPMAPIQGKPFLAYLLDYLQSQGITEVVLSVHYLYEQIQTYFSNAYRGIAIHYAIEDQPLGTGGAIVHALESIKTLHPVFVLNGDTFLQLDYRNMWDLHTKNSPVLTMALRSVPDCYRYGAVQVEGNTVNSFSEKGVVQAGLINAGVYLIEPTLFHNLPINKQFSFENEFLFPFVKQLKPQAFLVDNYFIDIGIPEDYANALNLFPIL